jgi:hypothetical protein
MTGNENTFNEKLKTTASGTFKLHKSSTFGYLHIISKIFFLDFWRTESFIISLDDKMKNVITLKNAVTFFAQLLREIFFPPRYCCSRPVLIPFIAKRLVPSPSSLLP